MSAIPWRGQMNYRAPAGEKQVGVDAQQQDMWLQLGIPVTA